MSARPNEYEKYSEAAEDWQCLCVTTRQFLLLLRPVLSDGKNFNKWILQMELAWARSADNFLAILATQWLRTGQRLLE